MARTIAHSPCYGRAVADPRLGQVFTPPAVADLTLALALPARGAAGADLAEVADVRALAAAEALAPGRAWTPLLRAPDAWFAALGAAGAALAPLHAVARVRRGATSGANAFFYLSRAEAARRRIEARFLSPLLKTPRDVAAIAVDPAGLPTLAFVCDLDERALAAFPGARAHVARHRALARRPTLAARGRWWTLGARPARLFLTKAYDARFAQRFSPAPLYADQRVYPVEPRAGVDVEVLAAVLNGTLAALALESLGRASLGEGVLEWSVADARDLPVLDPRRLSDLGSVVQAFRVLAGRPVGSMLAGEADAPDRRALDEALLAGAPAPLRALLPDLRRALVATVRERLARSRADLV